MALWRLRQALAIQIGLGEHFERVTMASLPAWGYDTAHRGAGGHCISGLALVSLCDVCCDFPSTGFADCKSRALQSIGQSAAVIAGRSDSVALASHMVQVVAAYTVHDGACQLAAANGAMLSLVVDRLTAGIVQMAHQVGRNGRHQFSRRHFPFRRRHCTPLKVCPHPRQMLCLRGRRPWYLLGGAGMNRNLVRGLTLSMHRGATLLGPR